jgi:hypothetical protein
LWNLADGVTDMSPFRLSALVLCAVALGFSGSARAATLLTNGGFETGNFTGWVQTGDTTFNGVQCPGTSSVVHGGNCSAFFGPVADTGGIRQTLTTIPGASYIVDFWLQPDGGTTSTFSASFGGTTLVSLNNPPASPFREFSFDVTATGTSTILAFNFRDDSGFMNLDDVSVTQTPLPAALPLFAGGLGVMGLLARRRKRKAATVAA